MQTRQLPKRDECVETSGLSHAPLSDLVLSGSISCRYCLASTFSNTTGAISCERCPLGTATELNTVGATSIDACVACVPGTYGQIGSNGESVCAPCSPGTFSSNAGSTSCLTCPGNTVTSTSGSSACAACPGLTSASSDHTTCQRTPSAQVNPVDSTPQPTGALASKRRRQLMDGRAKCATGLTECPVPGRRNLFDWYVPKDSPARLVLLTSASSLDLFTSLLFCGGCSPSTGNGTDCTDYDDRAEATCSRGRCVYKCPDGMIAGVAGCEDERR